MARGYRGIFKAKSTTPLKGSLGGFGGFATLATPPKKFNPNKSKRWKIYRQEP